MSPDMTRTCPRESALHLFEIGHLDEAIHAQSQGVKAEPLDQNQRLFLFELLVLAGEWDRATRQLAALQCHEAEREATIAVYRALLDAERQRHTVLTSGRSPQFLMEPTEAASKRVEALQHLVGKQPAEAVTILRELEETEPALCGELNGQAFQLLRDCDDLFGTVLEVFSTTGQYYWVPLQQIASVALGEPLQLRDLAWLPGTLEMRGGPRGDVFLPVRYHGSESHADDSIRLARATDWQSSEMGLTRGYGVRLFLVNDDALAIPDWRTLVVS